MSREDRGGFGDWQIVKRLGSGGNGEVSLWQNRKTRQKLAIKSLKFPPDHDQQKDGRRWRDEIAFAREIKHENIVQSVNVPEEFKAYLMRQYPPEPLIMEYCEKGDLRKKLQMQEHLNGMPEFDIRNIVKCMRNAIVHMHSKGISHRDIKPENLVIKEVNGCEVYKLTDLGYAREITSTIEASHVGTFEYFAPEVITELSYSNTVDYWSMGVIVFEIICGVRPFLPGSPVTDFISKLKLKDAKTIAITKSHDNRFENHSTLFEQNQISPCFKRFLEVWLRIPLDVNPRNRAIRTDNGPVSGTPSPASLKIFNDLDYLLSATILTVFCMHNFRLFSYNISEGITREGFLTTLSTDTEIPKDDLVIILPPENVHIARFTSSNKPIELYIDDLHDKPMVYCTTDKDTLKDTSQNVGLSAVLLEALGDNNVKNRKHALEVAKHLIFYVQQQGRFATFFMHALLNYAVMVDDWIFKFQGKVDEMSTMFWQLKGAMQFYLLQLDQTKNILVEKNVSAKLEDNSEKLIERFKKINDLFIRTRNRFISVLRRSKATISDLNASFNDHLSTIEKICDISTPCELYNKFRVCSSITDTAKEMFKYFNDFQKNWFFLNSAQIKNIQTSVSEIHVEFEIIETVVDGLIKQQVETQQLLNRMAADFSKSLWEIATSTASATIDGPNIPDLDGILSSKQANVAEELCELQNSCASAMISNGENWSMVEASEEAKSILILNSDLWDRVERSLQK